MSTYYTLLITRLSLVELVVEVNEAVDLDKLFVFPA